MNPFENIIRKWSICSKRANAPFSMIFSYLDISKASKGILLWSKGLIADLDNIITSTYLLWGNVVGEGPQIYTLEGVNTWEEEKQTLREKIIIFIFRINKFSNWWGQIKKSCV